VRRDFRVSVAAPRPASAWVMVTVASALLWITQQLDLWAMALQAAALIASLALRREPLRWQTSPVALNLGMLGIVAATIVVALRGEPSTIALAHFTALTQGLQLLDARPRRTEFLLVALALFQVVLAANLTDSVFFTPLLLAFVFATVWTLIVHTLRSEANEAGDAHDLPRTITPGLLRTTIIASGLSVLLALVLFLVLPRLRSSVVTGSGASPTLATAGFSDRVAFGELGRIRQDATVVLRVETLEGEPPAAEEAYFRGLAFDTFDGTSWSITPAERLPIPGSAESGMSLGRQLDDVDLVQRIVREPVAAGVLFRVGEVRGLQGTIRRLERDQSGGLYASGQENERVRYTVRTRRAAPDARDLRRDHAAPPPRAGERYLKLPPLSPAVSALAAEIVARADSDAERARAIERYLLVNGRYTDTPPAPGDDPRTPVERFLLGEMAGHCEYFASAMVLLSRSLGIPARLVNGFAGGRQNPIGGFVEVTRSDAHAWVEVHFAEAGWVRYDPTPADLRARPELALSFADRLRDLGSAIELWWFQRVVGFDRADQLKALKSAWLAWHGTRATARRARESARPAGDRWGFDGTVPWREGVVVLLCGGALLGVAWQITRRRRTQPEIPASYARALRLLARRGLVRDGSATARAFAARAAGSLHPAAARAFAALTESYLAERFGGHAGHDEVAQLKALREALRAPDRDAGTTRS
jgi:transglutaminase-like putative cysteine protease